MMERHSLKLQDTPPFGQTYWFSLRLHASDWITVFAGIFVFGVPLYVLLTVDLHPQNYTNIPLAMLIGFIGFYIAIRMNAVYRIAYDDEAIYMRPPQLTWLLQPKPFIRLPFDHIGLVTGERAPINQLFYGSNKATPFQHANVYPHTWPEGWNYDQVFLLTGAQIKNEEFRDLLWLINDKAPGTLDENIIEFLESDRKF